MRILLLNPNLHRVDNLSLVGTSGSEFVIIILWKISARSDF
jgi:hypothetical protein